MTRVAGIRLRVESFIGDLSLSHILNRASSAWGGGTHGPSANSIGVLDALVICAVQFFLSVIYAFFCQLPQQAYSASVIAVEVFKHGPSASLMLGNLVFALVCFRRLSWHTLDPTSGARMFVSIVAVTITWQFATYHYNFFYDQAHYFDRLLLIILALLVVWHPSFVPLFILFSTVIASQLHFPLPEAGWLWPDKKILFDVMLLFNAYLYAAASRKLSSQIFLFLTLCLTGALYFYAAIAKLSIGLSFYDWVFDNHISNLIVSSYLQSWFGFLDAAHIVHLWKLVRPFDLSLALGTVLIELSAILLLWSARVSQLILSGFVLLHLGIALASGIMFWKWCVFDVALIWFIKKTKTANGPSVYCLKLFLLSVALISVPYLFRQVHFAWYDTRVSNFFTISGAGKSGKIYNLGPRFFAPYDILFAQSRFYYLTRESVLVGTYGTTQDPSLANILEKTAPESMEPVRRQYGAVFYNEALANRFFEFVNRYVVNAQRRGSKSFPINDFAPPYHFGRVAEPNQYQFQEELVSLFVHFEEYLFTGEEILNRKRLLIKEIPVARESQNGSR